MRKISMISAIGLTLLWVLGFLFCSKHCVKIIGWTWSYSSEKAGKLGCEGITLNFDEEGRLFEATFKLKEGNKLDMEGLSLKAGDSPIRWRSFSVNPSEVGNIP